MQAYLQFLWAHFQGPIFWSLSLSTSVSVFPSFFIFLLQKQKHQSFYEYAFSLSAQEIFSISTLNSGLRHTHRLTHPCVMEIQKVISYTYVPICTIRTTICNFMNWNGTRRKNPHWCKIRWFLKSPKNSSTLTFTSRLPLNKTWEIMHGFWSHLHFSMCASVKLQTAYSSLLGFSYFRFWTRWEISNILIIAQTKY